MDAVARCLALLVAATAAGCLGSAARPGMKPIDAPAALPGQLHGIEVGLPADDPTVGAVNRITLAEAVQRASTTSLDQALAAAEEAVAKARAHAETAMLTPSLDFGGGVQNVDGDVQGSFGTIQDVNVNRVDPSVALVLDVNPLASYHRAVRARRDIDRAMYNRLAVGQRLILRVAELYENMVLAKAGVRVADALVANSERFVELTTARRDGGTGSASDVALAEAQRARHRQSKAATLHAWERASIALSVVLRVSPDKRLDPVEAALAPRSLVPSTDRWSPADAAKTRPDVAMAEIEKQMAERAHQVAWSELLGPHLFAEARESLIGTRWGNMNSQAAFGVSLGWSISFTKVERVGVRAAEADVRSLRHQQLEEAAIGEVRKAESDIRNGAKQIELARDARNAARRGLEISNARFTTGNTLAIEVIQAENAVARSEQSLARAITDYNLAQVRLLAAAGALTPAVFSTPDRSDS